MTPSEGFPMQTMREMLPQSGWIFHFHLSGGCSPLAGRGPGRYLGVKAGSENWTAPLPAKGYSGALGCANILRQRILLPHPLRRAHALTGLG